MWFNEGINTLKIKPEDRLYRLTYILAFDGGKISGYRGSYDRTWRWEWRHELGELKYTKRWAHAWLYKKKCNLWVQLFMANVNVYPFPIPFDLRMALYVANTREMASFVINNSPSVLWKITNILTLSLTHTPQLSGISIYIQIFIEPLRYYSWLLSKTYNKFTLA